MTTKDLEQIFKQLIRKYSDDEGLINQYWKSIKQRHSEPNRSYHNLNHLIHFYQQFLLIQDEILDPDSFLFALFYHDIIYDTNKQNNEYKSAEYALSKLKKTGLSKTQFERIENAILATKSHGKNDDSDITYFLDCDLAILGEKEENYQEYIESIREEFKNVPSFLFNAGRLKFVDSFLDKNQIFKSDLFHQKLEEQARFNLIKEQKQLRSKKEENLAKLYLVLNQALRDLNADEFVFEWEWETFMEPTQTIKINKKAIHSDYDIYFDFGEKELNRLVEEGILEKLEQKENEDETWLQIRYRKLK